MKKITQGKLEFFTSKADAINKLIQLQGVCKDIENSNNCSIYFYCNKNGKITVESLRSRHDPKKAQIFTRLYGEITEQNDKAYINYYTVFNYMSVFARISFFIIAIIILSIFMIFVSDKIKALIAIVVCVIGLVFQLITIEKEKKNLSENSNTLIDVLENKVNIINNWDK